MIQNYCRAVFRTETRLLYLDKHCDWVSRTSSLGPSIDVQVALFKA